MDEMPSSEFRRRYASLTKPTRVTVLGRQIGMWVPAEILDRADAEIEAVRQRHEATPTNVTPFNTRPFRPVPKGK